MNIRYAVQDRRQNSFVITSRSRDLILMSWPAYENDSNFNLVQVRNGSATVLEYGGPRSYEKPAPEATS